MKYEELVKPLEPGVELTLITKTNSFEPGDRTTLIGFVDGNPNKLILDGCIPGGWVKGSAVQRDFLPVRLMTCLEGMLNVLHFGNMWSNIIHPGVHKLMGSALDVSKIRVKDAAYIMYGDYTIPVEMLLPSEIPVLDGSEYNVTLTKDNIVVGDVTGWFTTRKEYFLSIMPDVINWAVQILGRTATEQVHKIYTTKGMRYSFRVANIPMDGQFITANIPMSYHSIVIRKGEEVILPNAYRTTIGIDAINGSRTLGYGTYEEIPEKHPLNNPELYKTWEKNRKVKVK